MSKRLDNKVAWVSGAASGMGEAIAHLFAEEGAAVALIDVQADKGRAVAKVGHFRGLRQDGAPAGLLFPASMAIFDGVMYITNLALPLTDAVGDEVEEDVRRWNIVRMRVTRH